MLKQIEGSRAMAEGIALCRPEVICAYPITPQTHIVEGLGEMVRTGELTNCEFINVESEFAALSVAIGASAAGARAYTATASQGLLFMAEAVYNASGLGLPIVMTLGNRAIGERSSQLVNVERLKIAAALVLTAPFVPMLFQGAEWGATAPFLYFTNHEDPELGRRVTEGRRREFAAFGWDPANVPDPQARNTFQRSKLDWSELDEGPHSDLLEWHRWLIDFRRQVAALSDGRLEGVEVNFDELRSGVWLNAAQW